MSLHQTLTTIRIFTQMKLRNEREMPFPSLLFFFTFYAFSFEFGMLAGVISKPSKLTYGLSAGAGFIVPMLKFEAEIYKISDTEHDGLTFGIKFRPKFGKLSPYAILGVGTEYKKFDFRTSSYKWFTFVGGGLHIRLMGSASLRLDVRYLNFSKKSRVRLTAGIFIHL